MKKFLKRKLNVELSSESLESFKSISVRMDGIEDQLKAAREEGASESFFNAAFAHKDKLQIELKDWWDNEKKSHADLPGSARVDTEAGCFFELVDEDGNVGAIGCVGLKIYTAIYNKVDIFFIPEENKVEAESYLKKIKTNMKIVYVNTLSEAINYLKGV